VFGLLFWFSVWGVAGCVLKSIKKYVKEQKSIEKNVNVQKRIKTYKKGPHTKVMLMAAVLVYF